MNIAKFIKAHKELRELPFLVVFSTISTLYRLGVLKLTEGAADVD